MNLKIITSLIALFFILNSANSQVYNVRSVAPDFKNNTPFELKFGDKIFPSIQNKFNNKFKFIVPVEDGLSITKVCYSPNGKWILTYSQNLSIRIWEAQSGKLLKTIKVPYKQLGDVLWSPDGQYIFTISDHWFSNNIESYADLWDVKTGVIKQSFYDSAVRIKMAKFSADNKYLLLMGGNTLKIYDYQNGTLLHKILNKDKDFENAGWSNNSNMFYTFSKNSNIKIWEVKLMEVIAEFNIQEGAVFFAEFTPDSKNILSLSKNGDIQIRNIVTGQMVNHFKSNIPKIEMAKYSPSGESVITKSADSNRLYLIALTDTIKIVTSFIINNDMSFSWSPTGRYFTIGKENGLLMTFNSVDGSFKTGKIAFKSKINSISWSPDEKYIVASSDENNPQIRSAVNSELKLKLQGCVTEISELKWNENGSIKLFSVKKDIQETDQTLPDLNFKQRGGNEYAFNKEKVSSKELNISVLTTNLNYSLFYNFKEDTIKFILEGTARENKVGGYYIYDYMDVLFSPDKNFIITFSDKYTLKLWDFKSAQLKCDIICIDTADYVFRLPGGFYMASRDGMKKLHYVDNKLRVISFEQLDIKYNRPDKVLEAIGNIDTALIKSYRKAYEKRIKKLGVDTTAFRDGYSVPEADFANRDKIEFEQKDGKLKLDIKTVDSTYKLDRFNIWINEIPLYGQRGISLRKMNLNNFDTAITIKLSQGENKIETSISNVNGTESYRMPLEVNYTTAVKQKESVRFIGIGIDQFNESKYNLKYSTKDIRDLSKKLKEKYKDIIIDTLFNEDVTISKVKALKQKLLQTSVNDKVIISYSGHGLLSKEYDYYLSTYAVNFEKPEQNGLPYDELENLLDSIPARKKLMLIDACHSGEVDKEEGIAMNKTADSLGLAKGIIIKNKNEPQLGLKNSFELMQSLFVNVGKSTGATIISAAAGNQFALERGDLKNGVFTFAILEAMKNHSTIKISELKKIVGERVEQLTNGLQKPTSRNETIAVDWSVW